jgi:hypothetical protein
LVWATAFGYSYYGVMQVDGFLDASGLVCEGERKGKDTRMDRDQELSAFGYLSKQLKIAFMHIH